MLRLTLLLLFLLIPAIGDCLSDNYKSSFTGEIKYLLYKFPHVAYKWGATDIYVQRVGDCSGTLYAISRRIGMPVERVEAIHMEAGRGGWKNKPVILKDADELTFVWWTWANKPSRPHGHVGVLFVSPVSGLLEVVHNSQSKGLHIEPLTGVLLKDLSSIKVLTIGDKQDDILGPGIEHIK